MSFPRHYVIPPAPLRHSRAGGNLEFTPSIWIPACAGMTT